MELFSEDFTLKTNIGALLSELEDKEPEDEFPYEELDVLVEYLCSIIPIDIEEGTTLGACPFNGIDMNTLH